MLNNSTVKFAEQKEKNYRISDNRAMYLLVTPTGKKYWRLDYRLHGKRRTYAIGSYPEISLKEARKLRDKARRLIAKGIDPVQERQQTRAAQQEAHENSFENVAWEWVDKKKQGWTPGYARTIEGRLKLNLLPWLSKRPVSEITAPELLRALRKVEARGAIESAHRTLQIANSVFIYSIACGIADHNPAFGLTKALQSPNPKKMAALTDPIEVGGLMRAIREYHGGEIVRCALRFSAYTFCRPGEIRTAEWDEIDWIKAEWRIPAAKMKMKRDHIVPLANQVISVLQEIHVLTGSGRYVFPSLRANKPMSNNTVNAAIRYMGYAKSQMCAHGFRAMASSLLHENGFEHDVIELQLSHQRKDRIAHVYDRSQRLPERRKMMQWYADYLDELKKDDKRAMGHGR